jgi:hypothetical protein
MEKQSQVRFPSGVTREKWILELVHSDVFSPISMPSLGGSIYYVSFIDDFCRKTWIYFLRKNVGNTRTTERGGGQRQLNQLFISLNNFMPFKQLLRFLHVSSTNHIAYGQ